VSIPKLIALDVDGTLLTSTGELHARTIAAIARVRRHGVAVAIATGRPVDAIGSLAGLADFLVAGNGTTVVSVVDDAVGPYIYDRIVTRQRATPIVHAIRAMVPDVGFALVTANEMVNEAGFELILPHEAPIGRRVGDVLEADGDDFRSIVVFHPDRSAAELIEMINPMLLPELEMRYAGLDAGEISEPDVDKAKTLAWLADHLGLAQHEVWAFGDGANDNEMLAWAGRGHAMGNAGAELKALANVVVPTNDDHGVAVTLDRIEFSGTVTS
jgi:Cof subfamily protein (haloacid dehalogenase superfamily)